VTDDEECGRTCVDCRRESPRTETAYTLISARFGWRLHRRTDSTGRFDAEWRCPECWESFKSRVLAAGSELPPSSRRDAVDAASRAGAVMDRAGKKAPPKT
jgi:hypothetical protein